MDIEERGVRLRLTIVDTPGEKSIAIIYIFSFFRDQTRQIMPSTSLCISRIYVELILYIKKKNNITRVNNDFIKITILILEYNFINIYAIHSVKYITSNGTV